MEIEAMDREGVVVLRWVGRRKGGGEKGTAWWSDRLLVLVTHGMLGRALRGFVLESIQEML